MNGNVFYVEVKCKDGTKARIRADEITTIIERKTDEGFRVTLPTRAKTLETVHTLEDFWTTLEAAIGGIKARIEKVPEAPFPDPNAATIATTRKPKAA